MPDPNKNLQHIEISGFKSIDSLSLKMQPINILIGANGAEKSNFISIFKFLRSMAEGKFQQHIKNNGGGNAFLHFGSKVNSP